LQHITYIPVNRAEKAGKSLWWLPSEMHCEAGFWWFFDPFMDHVDLQGFTPYPSAILAIPPRFANLAFAHNYLHGNELWRGTAANDVARVNPLFKGIRLSGGVPA
jgi:hypothetical protein